MTEVYGKDARRRIDRTVLLSESRAWGGIDPSGNRGKPWQVVPARLRTSKEVGDGKFVHSWKLVRPFVATAEWGDHTVIMNSDGGRSDPFAFPAYCTNPSFKIDESVPEEERPVVALHLCADDTGKAAHWFAIGGAGGGSVFGIITEIVDLTVNGVETKGYSGIGRDDPTIVFTGQIPSDRYTWKYFHFTPKGLGEQVELDVNPFTGAVKIWVAQEVRHVTGCNGPIPSSVNPEPTPLQQ